MADRQTAGLFGSIFEFLAKHPDDRNKSFAKYLVNLTADYDFSPYQMDCDEALIELEVGYKNEDDEIELIYK